MPSTYTSSGIELIADGEQSGLWGQTTNTNLEIINRMIAEAGSISLSGTTHTLTISDGILSDGQYAALVFGGSPSGTNTVTINPNDAKRIFFVINSSGQSVVLTQGSGGNVTILNGDSKIVYTDGAGASAKVTDITDNFAMGSVNIDGGTIDGVTLGTNSAVTEAQIDNININGNAITSTDTNGNIALTPNGTGEVDISKVDIDGGTIDGTTIGGSTPAAISGTTGTFSGNLTVDTDTLFVDATNNEVGIGTTSPGAKLDVLGPASVTSFTGTSRLGVTVRGSTAATDYSGIDFIGSSQSNPVARIAVLSTVSGSSLQFGTSNSYGSGITNTALTIDPSGGVGIGVTSPATTLHVSGTSVPFVLDSSNSNLFKLDFRDANATVGYIGASSAAPFVVGSSGALERLRIDSNGSMGVGTNSPNATGWGLGVTINSAAASNAAVELTEDGTLRGYMSLTAGGGFNVYAAAGQNLVFGAGAAERMRITSGGLVGIGTNSPGATLEVAGDAANGLVRLGQVQFKNSSGNYSAGADGIHIFPFSDGILYHDNYDGGFAWRTGTSATERMRVTDTGLGIGTSSINSSLQVSKTQTVLSGTSNTYGVHIYPTSSGATYVDGITGGAGGAGITLRSYNNGTYNNVISGTTDTATTTFQTGGVERVRITSTGLGIGTTPAVALHVSGPSVPVFIDSTNSNTYKLGFRDSTTTRGYIGASSAAEFTVASAAASERLRVDTAGNLLVNTTSAGGKITVVAGTNYNGIRAYASSGGYVGVYGEHSLNGGTGYVAYFYNTGAGNGQYIANGGSWLAISDERQKEDVKDLDATERLMQLRPVDYLWKHQAASEEPDRRNLGFIAQEVQQVFPELVSTSPDGMLGVEYTGLIAPLVKALQEATQKIEALEARVAALEA